MDCKIIFSTQDVYTISPNWKSTNISETNTYTWGKLFTSHKVSLLYRSRQIIIIITLGPITADAAVERARSLGENHTSEKKVTETNMRELKDDTNWPATNTPKSSDAAPGEEGCSFDYPVYELKSASL